MEWKFDPNAYAPQKETVSDEEFLSVLDKQVKEQEYKFDDDLDKRWAAFVSESNSGYRSTRTKMTPSEKIDKVIECLVSGVDDKDAYMTREEIGIYFHYAQPANAIAIMHQAHLSTLEPLSEKREVLDSRGCIREKVFYSPKGVYEIACYSKQQKSSDFFRDFLKAVEQNGVTGGAN